VAAERSGRPRAQAPASGRAEVRRRRVARHVQQMALPLVQGTPTEAIVRCIIVIAIARHCSRFCGELIGEKVGVNAARRSSAAGFYSVQKTMRGRRCDEDDIRPFSPTSRGHQTRGNFPQCFPRICFLRTPRARPEGPGMAWARRMDESPNPGKNEEPGARLGHFSPSG
jgi:hypothetical protein